MTPEVLAAALLGGLFKAVAEWLEGKREEPPELIHLGLSQAALADARQRANAAKRLGGGE